MTKDQIREVVLRSLSAIAPEADLGTLDPKRDLRDQLDVDSVDFMNFVVALHHELGVDVPEADYSKLSSLDGCVAYLAVKTGAS